MQKYLCKFARLMILLLGAAVTVNGIALLFVTNVNTGLILTLLLGVAILLYGIFFHYINKSFPRWIEVTVMILVLIALCFGVFLHINGTTDNVTYQEDAIVVLGASVNKETPSVTLMDRLNVAVEYYKKNLNVLIVVSGGQGAQEAITEAQAMETYLVSKGVPKDNIIKEEASTSTYENFCNSKAILDAHFQEPYSVAFVTSEYHIYRAGSIAKTVGVDSATHIHSTTKWHLILPSTLRECLAVVKFWIFRR